MSKEPCTDPKCACSKTDFDLDASLRDTIEKQGVAMIGVYPDDGKGFFLTYTVGLTEKNIPELVVTGMPTRPAYAMLTAVVDAMLHNEAAWEAFLNNGGGRKKLGAASGLAVELDFVPINPEGDPPLGAATRLYGPAVRALQVIWPDEEFRHPSELEYNAADYPQPMLERA